MPLNDVFEEFRNCKATLEKIHQDTIKCFDEIEGKLSSPRDEEIAAELTMATSPSADPTLEETVCIGDVRFEFDFRLSELLYTTKEKKEVAALFSEEPALIFVGQTNCGKSSIINEILGCKALPTSEQPSTARIVRVSYSKEPFCYLLGKNGEKLQNIKLKGKNKIPRSRIELKQQDREDTSKVEATIETGLDIEFLKSGVSVIDSPGRNENEALDNLVKEKLENPLAFVIYVIDGHNLFTKQDREVLSDMTSQRPDLPIFFVVSKLEPEDRTESSDEEEESTPGLQRRLKEETEVHSRKKKRVYERLVRYGYFPAESNQAIDGNERFHGLSAWRIQKYNQMKKTNPEAADEEFGIYIQAFDRFQNCLKKFAEESLRERVERVCQILIRVQSRCLDFFIRKANVLKKGQQMMTKTLEVLLKQEEEVHANIIRSLEDKLIDQEIEELLLDVFKNAREGILQEAEKFEYALREYPMPRDGYITGKAAVAVCKEQLQRMVVNKIQGDIKENLTMMFRSRDVFVTQMKERIEQIEQEIYADSVMPSAALALGRSLLSSYDAQISFEKRDGLISRVILSFAKWCYSFLSTPIRTLKITLKGKEPVGSSEWKKGVASDVLKRVDPSQMTKEIIRSLKEHFTLNHEEFVEEVKKVQSLFCRGKTIKDEQRQKILEFGPNIALLEMLAYGVMDKFKYGFPKKGELIGSGAQGSVFACENMKTSEGKPCVVKVVKVAKEEVLKDLTLELHNTRSLQHPNILPILCSVVQSDPMLGSLSVSLVSERMKCDLQEGLPRIPSLRKRLEIALDVAKALQYLHSEDLIHRDVKLQNVLLDETNQAKLTDLGLCKPEGLACNSLVGTPVYMAPEMIKQQYDKTIDVYAFGMLLWRVCEGKGNQPENVHKHFLPLVMLMLNAVDNKTPERLDVFPESCWDIMQRCWVPNPEQRPSFDVIVKDLEDFLRDADF
ncbi:dual serine/threonine and tyrosine protein kinase-like [Montipora capricornis]|uniref:dual serine/threonine and tyrosine protein kinase-like n=1 Tax=Montipora capricornis TaxID=246305 RepID=UPI0035F2056B